MKIKEKINKLLNKIKTLIKNKIKFSDKAKFNTVEIILVIVMALTLGLLIGEVVFTKDETERIIIKENTTEIEKVYNTLLKESYNTITKEELTQAAINGMMDLLNDEHSTYIDEENTEELQIRLNGEFVGMGAQITRDEKDNVVIANVFDDSPAKKAGLEAGDIILKLNNQSVEKMELNAITNQIKGKSKTVIITIKRDNKEKSITVSTGKVILPSVSSEVITKDNKKIGYIYLGIFALNSDEQFKEHLLKLEEQKIDSLIIDVRANTGGHLDTVKNIASLFLNEKDIICQIKTKTKTEKLYSSENNNRKYKIIVLTDGGSASASEVLASALKEEYGATLVGTKTYGKGTVQKVLNLKDGSMIKYTAETWLTPSGKSIDKIGITPDVEIELSEEYNQTGKKEDDNQFQKALEIISK